METILCLSLALMAGLLMSRLSKKLGLPAVTAYLVAGIIVGPFVLGRLGIDGVGFTSTEQVKSFNLISQVALGFIAFAIGNEFRLSQLRETGKKATIIAFAEALGATVLTDIALIGLHFLIPEHLTLPMAITMGAIATATAPAATLMVVRQYKAKGAVTELLLPIVALDDAICLVVFAISFGVARAMTNGHFDALSIVVEPLVEIVLSIALGFVMGLLLTWIQRLFASNSKRLCLAIGFIMLTVAVAMSEFDIFGIHISFSSLLVCMMLGTVFCNKCEHSAEIMEKADRWSTPLLLLFFVLSGAELELNVFSSLAVVGVGVVYVVSRSIGKYSGAYASSRLLHCEKNVYDNLGITLLPQAGVAMGMSITAQTLPEGGDLIRNIVLFAVLIYELVGPLLTKLALTRSGDIAPKAPEQIERELAKAKPSRGA